jgi:hypothetical protein
MAYMLIRNIGKGVWKYANSGEKSTQIPKRICKVNIWY